jgi:chromosome segregation ATPase
MASLEKLVIGLRQKKRVVATKRKRAQKHLQEAQTVLKRSVSGLQTLDKKITFDKEQTGDLAGILNQKESQLESINRLLVYAKDRLDREREELNQVEQELEFAENPEEKERISQRLNSIKDHIEELEFEIISREKTAKKVTQEVAEYSEMKSKIFNKIKRQAKSKPTLKKIASKSRKAGQKFAKDLKQKTMSELSVEKSLEKVSSKLRKL